MSNTLSCILHGEEHTEAAGRALAALAQPQMKIYLQGELGSGKTTLARGFIRSLGHNGVVASPSYTLVEEYKVRGLTVYHIDLYRTAKENFTAEWTQLSEYLQTEGLCLLEWPERGAGLLPQPDIELKLEHTDNPGNRKMKISCDNTGIQQKITAAINSITGTSKQG